MKDSVLSFLGLAAKAGRLIYGSEAGSNAARSRRAKLVIVACDAADNTKKLMQNMNGDIFAESGNDQMTVTAVFSRI